METPRSTVPVVCATGARTGNRDVAAGRGAVQTCRAAAAGGTELGAAGGLLAGPRVHVDDLRRRRRRRCGGGRGRRPERDITLDGASEFDQVRVSGPSREGKDGASGDRKSTRLNSSHRCISYAVFCLKKKKVLLVVIGEEAGVLIESSD